MSGGSSILFFHFSNDFVERGSSTKTKLYLVKGGKMKGRGGGEGDWGGKAGVYGLVSGLILNNNNESNKKGKHAQINVLGE